MEVSLNKEQEKFVNELISNGTYYSPSEAVRDGLRLLKEQEELKKIRTEELKSEIMLGIEDLKSGNSKSFSSPDEIFQEGRERGRKKISEKK